MSLPDKQVTAKAKSKSMDMNIPEEALEEHHSKTSKQDTNFATATELSGLNSDSVLLTRVNLVGIVNMCYKFLLTCTALISSMSYHINQVTT